MIVPIINKQYEKDKLMDLINSCGLTKTEIAKATDNHPHGFGKISIQTMYDLEIKKPDGKPDQLKLFQLKEILRVIGNHQNKNISLGSFVSPDLSKVRVVLEWNHAKYRFEVPDLLNSPAKAIYFPNWLNQNPNIRAIVTHPNKLSLQDEPDKTIDYQYSYRKDSRISLFDLNKNNWNKIKPDYLLWRHCLVKVKDKNYYYQCIPHEFINEYKIITQRYLGYVYRTGVKNKDEKFWIPTYEHMTLEYDEIYPITTIDVSMDDENTLIDLE